MEKLKNKLKEFPRVFSSIQRARDAVSRLVRRTTSPTIALAKGALPEFFHTSERKSRVITRKSIRAVERKSIRDFLEEHRSYLRGRVLDFGAGEQPYKDLIEGEYLPFEKGEELPHGPFDAILMNQVAQYLPDPIGTLSGLAKMGRYLVMTYPTNWYEVEDNDWWRFTKVGMERILTESGYEVLVHEPRCLLEFDNFTMTIGYGVIAKSTRLS